MIRPLAAALAGLAGLGCAGDRATAAQLAAAAQPGHLPHVVACWEKEFEGAGFQGSYLATVDFVVEGETSRLRDARVTALQHAGGYEDEPGVAPAAASLAACVEAALNRSALPTAEDRDGPGFVTSSDLVVRGYRIVFVDASPGRRERASAQQAHVLLGPRADRCQGLYAHDPPRHASVLLAAAANQEAKAKGFADEDRDHYARELQKTYDLQMELRERLRLDALDPDLPAANRRRLLAALTRADSDLRKTGSLIGCEVPPISHPDGASPRSSR
jgi:hypothetical protein